MQPPAATPMFRQGWSGRPLRWVSMFALAAILAIAAGAASDRWLRVDAALDPASIVVGFGPADYGTALQRIDQDIAGARRQLALAPGEWLRSESLARALIRRARLTGDYDDLTEASRLIDEGLAAAPDPAGPALVCASLSLALHRLPEAERALARVSRWAVSTSEERADALALKGDIAQQRGDTASAALAYGRAQAIAPDTSIALRQAVMLARTGKAEEGKRRVEALLARPRRTPQAVAELALQRAQLAYAEGDWLAATEWVDAANQVFRSRWTP